ncbi:MAG: helix-turn-helix domain-containing protein [Rhodospirillaceae bacterium]
MIEDTGGPVTLDALAARTGYSLHHLQRTFIEAVGISPKQYGDALRAGRLRRELRQGNGVADAVFGAGYGSASRVYEKSSALFGMTPASYAAGGQGADIRFAVAQSPLGRVLVAATGKGLCMVSVGSDDTALEQELRADFSKARIQRDDRSLGGTMVHIVDILADGPPDPALSLDVRATAFQWQVW